MTLFTGGAMPPEGHIRHASSEELRRIVIQSIAELARRNHVQMDELHADFLEDIEAYAENHSEPRD